MGDDEITGVGGTLDAEARVALAALAQIGRDIISDTLTFERRKRLLGGMLQDCVEIKSALAGLLGEERPA